MSNVFFLSWGLGSTLTSRIVRTIWRKLLCGLIIWMFACLKNIIIANFTRNPLYILIMSCLHGLDFQKKKFDFIFVFHNLRFVSFFKNFNNILILLLNSMTIYRFTETTIILNGRTAISYWLLWKRPFAWSPQLLIHELNIYL